VLTPFLMIVDSNPAPFLCHVLLIFFKKIKRPLQGGKVRGCGVTVWATARDGGNQVRAFSGSLLCLISV
jgi:hypothetical protein